MCANFQLHCAAMEYQVFVWYIPYTVVFRYSDVGGIRYSVWYSIYYMMCSMYDILHSMGWDYNATFNNISGVPSCSYYIPCGEDIKCSLLYN